MKPTAAPIPWTTSDILKATGGDLLCGDVERAFAGVSIDSRAIDPDDLFVVRLKHPRIQPADEKQPIPIGLGKGKGVVVLGFALNGVQAHIARFDDQGQRLGDAAARVQGHRQAIAVKKVDHLLVIGEDQLAQHLWRCEQAAVVADVVGEHDTVRQANLLEHVGKVRFVEIGVDPVVVVDPVGVVQQAGVQGDIAHAQAHQLPHEPDLIVRPQPRRA